MLYAQLHAAAVALQDRARLCCEPGDQLVARASLRNLLSRVREGC
jgi:hypothetical protein